MQVLQAPPRIEKQLWDTYRFTTPPVCCFENPQIQANPIQSQIPSHMVSWVKNVEWCLLLFYSVVTNSFKVPFEVFCINKHSYVNIVFQTVLKIVSNLQQRAVFFLQQRDVMQSFDRHDLFFYFDVSCSRHASVHTVNVSSYKIGISS